MTISYQNTSELIVFTAKHAMQSATHSLNHKFVAELQVAERDTNTTASLIKNKILDVNNVDDMLVYFHQIAKNFTIVQAIYWGNNQGNYISAEYEDDDTITSYFIDKKLSPPSQLSIKRDKNDTIISSSTINTDYDSRHRPWYQDALNNKKSIWTDIYLYQPTERLGITYATPVYDEKQKILGVVGVDIRLDWLSWYIDTIKLPQQGILFIVRTDGKLIAYPHMSKLQQQKKLPSIYDLPSTWISDAFDLYHKNKSENFKYSYNGINYLASFRSIPILKGQGWLVGLVIPEHAFISGLDNIRTTSIITNLIIMIAGILIVSALVNNIVRPVNKLIVETNKIKNFNLDDKISIKTHVKEILLLSEAIETMKSGLKAFKKYIPSELVKQLIVSGENVKVGGEKKMIVSLFTDIKDFTTITHTANPTTVVEQLNEYFEALTSIIIKENGTIDKYIGDSIMAFWGAPIKVEYPCHHAATAALQCIEKINDLNVKWQQEGKLPFHTRIGIHYGEAIVGNLGSTERINYTAIGDSINIASRLEGKNKELNTSILVSETVWSVIQHQFHLEEVGFVSLKGISEKIRVYALISNDLSKSQTGTKTGVEDHFFA